jgi:hypothetical protein
VTPANLNPVVTLKLYRAAVGSVQEFLEGD